MPENQKQTRVNYKRTYTFYNTQVLRHALGDAFF